MSGRLCPLFKDPCKKEKCVWYLDKDCAIPAMAGKLIRGVLTVRAVSRN